MWVFGYGSLMWNPGFPHAERRPAILNGYHRAYMMYSTRNRGTPDCPGAVLSLAPGRSCTGIAYRIAPGREAEALAYLDGREGAGRANKRVRVPLRFADNGAGPPVHGWTYLPILTYSNYIGGVPPRRQAELVAQGAGKTGSAFDYLARLMEELARLGVQEPALEELHRESGRLRQPPPAPVAGDDPASRRS
jgi:cation transport protein ChaC